MSCDTDHTVILKHRTADTLEKAVNRFNKLTGKKPSKISKTSAKYDIFRNESNWGHAYCIGEEDTVANLAIRLAWNYPGVKVKYESKNEYKQFEECEVCISTEAKEALDTLIESAEGNPEDRLRLGALYMEDDSNVLELNDNDYEQPEPHDLPEALKWIQSAAEAGLSEAYLKLGGMYGEGEGVPEDKTQGLAHALVAQKLDEENEDAALLIKKISGGINKKEKEKAQKLAEDIAGEIDTADIISTRSPEEVANELSWILYHDDLKSLKQLVGTADYANAVMHEDCYSVTYFDLYENCFMKGAYSCAAYLGEQGFFSPICFDSPKPKWAALKDYIDSEEVYCLSNKKPKKTRNDWWKKGKVYDLYQPSSDKTTYYWDTKKDDKKALDKFLAHILSDHPALPHCINWDRKGAEELLEAAKGKKMSKTVTALNKLLKPAT